MSKQHTVIYVPGLGDTNISNRKKILGLWHYKNIELIAHTVKWHIDEPWTAKLNGLLDSIDKQLALGKSVSLIGESAGASAVMQALQHRADSITAVILLCGKSQHPDRLGHQLRRINPRLYEAVSGSHTYIQTMSDSAKAKVLNLHPLVDPVVPVHETKIHGVKNIQMPSFGHAISIVFGMTIWSFKIVKFIRIQGNKS